MVLIVPLTFEQENQNVMISLKFQHDIHCVVMTPLQTHSTRMSIVLSSSLNIVLQEVHCVVISSQIRAGASLCCNFLQHVLEESSSLEICWKEAPSPAISSAASRENGLTCLLCNWYLSMVSEVFWNSDVTMTGN